MRGAIGAAYRGSGSDNGESLERWQLGRLGNVGQEGTHHRVLQKSLELADCKRVGSFRDDKEFAIA